MKKLLIFLGVLLLVSGCGKYNDKDLIKENFKLREKNFKLFFQVEELQKEIENLKKGGKND